MYEKSDTKLIIFDMEGTVVHETTAYESVPRLLELLGKTEIKLALLSDFEPEKVKKILDDNGLDSESFHSIVKSLHYGEAYESIMADFGAKTGETLVCTSSSVALKLASRMGIKTCAVKGRFSESIYKKAGADIVLGDVGGIVEII